MHWELCTQGYVGGPMSWGTNELGDQWEHGRKGYTGWLMRWETNEICVPRFTLGDQWDWGGGGGGGGGINENMVERATQED